MSGIFWEFRNAPFARGVATHLFFYPSRMVGAARKKRVKVPDGALGILLKQEPDLGLVVYASPDVKPCRVAPVVVGARLMQIDAVSVNDLAPWIVAEMIKTKTGKTFTIIPNSVPVARQLGSSAAETASDARFRFSTPDEHLFHPTSAPSTAYLVVHNAECVLVG